MAYSSSSSVPNPLDTAACSSSFDQVTYSSPFKRIPYSRSSSSSSPFKKGCLFHGLNFGCLFQNPQAGSFQVP